MRHIFPSGSRWALVVLAVAAAVLILLDVNGSLSTLGRLTSERSGMQTEVGVLEQTKAALGQQIGQATQQAAVESWAHSEGRMVKPGEVLVVPVPEGSQNATPTPVQEPTPAPVQNWVVWKALFLDP
jgi:cell division protein FtsB